MNEIISDPKVISFPKLGWEFTIDPTAFSIGNFEVQWYGIIIAVGLLLAVLYCFPRMKRFGLDADRASDVVIGGVIGGIIGARLYYVLPKWNEYQQDTFKDTFLAVINTRNGGLAIYGGIIGAVIVGLVMCKIRKVKVLPMLDVAAIGFLIGQGIGRWGNFVNQEAFGTNTDFILGMTGGRIQTAAAAMSDMNWNEPVHPCFLYESIWCLLGFALLAFWSKRRKYDGQLILMYMTWYGLERSIVEGLRTDSLMVGNIRISQALSAVLFVTSVILQVIFFLQRKRDPESFTLYAGTEESILLIEESRRKKMGVEGADAKILADDGDDEIGILPDEDDEIGELPDIDDDEDDDPETPEEEDNESDDTEESDDGSDESEEEDEESDDTEEEDIESDDTEEENAESDESDEEDVYSEDDEEEDDKSTESDEEDDESDEPEDKPENVKEASGEEADDDNKEEK